MAQIDSVSAALLIRFGLEQLSAKNSHHDFEHLCRHLARTVICVNILPSTGPVSKGGDQGIDFETFQIPDTSIEDLSAFHRHFPNKHIVFACTIRKAETVPAKVKEDIEKILTNSPDVIDVYYFAGADIPISTRNELKTWAKKEHSISLEIFDGQAVSELLADPEVIWIAERFLAIPPDILKGDSIYREALCVAESNILDVYFLKAPLTYKFKVVNRSEADWSNIIISAWIAFFGQNNPLVDLTFERVYYKTNSLLTIGDTIEVDLTQNLGDIFASNIDLRNVLLNPYGYLQANPQALMPNSQLSINASVAPLPQRVAEIVAPLLKQPTNLQFMLHTGNVRAGFINIVIIEGQVDYTGGSGHFQKVVPFVNMWLTRRKVIDVSSDIYFVNAPATVSCELWQGTVAANTTKAAYEIQDDRDIRTRVREDGGKVERPKVTATNNVGMSITAHTLVILADDNNRFFDFGLKPTGQAGKSIAFENPFE